MTLPGAGGRFSLDRHRLLSDSVLIVGALALCTVAALILEGTLGLPDASAVYLLGVAAVAIRAGATPAVATAFGAFAVYNFAFVDPRFTFTVANPDQLLNLVLFLVIGALIGRLAGSQRDRAREALRREREAQALHSVSRALNSSDSLEAAVVRIAERLAADTRMQRVWVAVATDGSAERVLADTDAREPRPEGPYALLRRDDAEGPVTWRRIHPPERRVPEISPALYRVELAVGEESFGSVWAVRDRELGQPGAVDSRLLAAAADQIAQAVRRRRLVAAAAELEIAKRSDRLKTALLDSVSHDLRTPLATIRAAAGSLSDPQIEVSETERIALGATIDAEAQRLNRLVGNLLDMSRIESGALNPELEVVPLASIVEAVVDRLRTTLARHRLEVDVPDDLPPVLADPLMLDQVLTNLLENAAKYVPAGGRIRVRATRAEGGGVVTMRVEDDGPGVSGDAQRVFDKFHREARDAAGSRRGTGLGLAVVRGLSESMGGTVRASRSELGGFAVLVDLPADVADRQAAGARP